MRGTCGFPSLRERVHACVLRSSRLDGKAIAKRLGIPYQTFMSDVSGQPKHKLNAEWLLPIMAVTGSVEPLQFMAREMGGVFVKVEPCAGTGGLMGTLIASVKEFGDYVTECAADIADGKLPRDQHDRILKEGQEALAAIAAMLEMVREVHKEQFGGADGYTCVQALQRVVRGFQQDRDLRGYAVFALGFRPDETKTFYIAGGVIPDDAMYGALENMIEAMFSRSDQIVLPPEAQETQQ